MLSAEPKPGGGTESHPSACISDDAHRPRMWVSLPQTHHHIGFSRRTIRENGSVMTVSSSKVVHSSAMIIRRISSPFDILTFVKNCMLGGDYF